MKFGLTEDQFQYLDENVVAPLQNLGFEICGFGSRARGDHDPFSDLDLMIEGTVSPAGQRAKSAIEEQLTKSSFPFKVELVFFEEFADSYKLSYKNDRTA